MNRHIDDNHHGDRYFQIGIAVFSFLVSCALGALAFYILLSLSAMSQQ